MKEPYPLKPNPMVNSTSAVSRKVCEVQGLSLIGWVGVEMNLPSNWERVRAKPQNWTGILLAQLETANAA
jgi:hypothetical protein